MTKIAIMLMIRFKEAFLDLGKGRDIILWPSKGMGEIKINPKGEFKLKEGDHIFVISEEEPSGWIK